MIIFFSPPAQYLAELRALGFVERQSYPLEHFQTTLPLRKPYNAINN